jgi:hypothetical protein
VQLHSHTGNKSLYDARLAPDACDFGQPPTSELKSGVTPLSPKPYRYRSTTLSSCHASRYVSTAFVRNLDIVLPVPPSSRSRWSCSPKWRRLAHLEPSRRTGALQAQR